MHPNLRAVIKYTLPWVEAVNVAPKVLNYTDIKVKGVVDPERQIKP